MAIRTHPLMSSKISMFVPFIHCPNRLRVPGSSGCISPVRCDQGGYKPGRSGIGTLLKGRGSRAASWKHDMHIPRPAKSPVHVSTVPRWVLLRCPVRAPPEFPGAWATRVQVHDDHLGCSWSIISRSAEPSAWLIRGTSTPVRGQRFRPRSRRGTADRLV